MNCSGSKTKVNTPKDKHPGAENIVIPTSLHSTLLNASIHRSETEILKLCIGFNPTKDYIYNVIEQ
jgi:hypothetical protein